MSYPKQVYTEEEASNIIRELRQTISPMVMDGAIFSILEVLFLKIEGLESQIDKLRSEMYEMFANQGKFSKGSFILDLTLSFFLPVAGSVIAKQMAKKMTDKFLKEKGIREKILTVDWSNPKKDLGKITIVGGTNIFGESVKIIDAAILEDPNFTEGIDDVLNTLKHIGDTKPSEKVEYFFEKLFEKGIEFSSVCTTGYIQKILQKGAENNYNNNFVGKFSKFDNMATTIYKAVHDWTDIQKALLTRAINSQEEESSTIALYTNLKTIADGEYNPLLDGYFKRLFQLYKKHILITGTTLYKAIFCQFSYSFGFNNVNRWAQKLYESDEIDILRQLGIYDPFSMKETLKVFEGAFSLNLFEPGNHEKKIYFASDGICKDAHLYYIYIHCIVGYIEGFGNRLFLFLELEEGASGEVYWQLPSLEVYPLITDFKKSQPSARRTVGYYLLHEIVEFLDDYKFKMLNILKFKELALQLSEGNLKSRTGWRITGGNSIYSFVIPTIPKSIIINTLDIKDEPIDVLR